MIKQLNILVTGCGGDIGLSMGKILKEMTYVEQVYGCDISDRNAAKFVFDKFFLGLPVNDPNYIQNLEKEVKERSIDFIIPVSEHELRLFAKKNVGNFIADKLIIASQKALDVGFDKLRTAEFLKERGLPSPKTQKITKSENVSYPVIAKSRTGSGSSKIELVQDEDALSLLKKTNPDFIVQEYLDGTEGEFTCGLFRSKKGEVRSIIFKRELHGSYSGYGEVVKNVEIEKLLYRMAEELELIGSINVQLRLTSKGPTVFEINPRFSSTVRFRDLMGFKDVEWSLQDKLALPLSDYRSVPAGKKFYKGFVEYIR
jgi:carbamoyl-phosphate synthase large subunit